MFAAQQGRCAICGREQEERLAVDHNHTTGRVRGLVCKTCNRNAAVVDGVLAATPFWQPYIAHCSKE